MTQVAAWKDHGGIQVLRMTGLEGLGGVQAFFTGRAGGVSPRWEGGLNWSHSVGDEAGHVRENRRLTLDLMGLKPHQAVMAGLVHGNRVVAVTGEEAEAGPDDVRLVPDCDALITDRPGVALIITAADCVPIFLYAPVRRAVAAVHAGWRSTVAGICGETVRAMVQQYGCNPADIHAAIGPSIGPCCYEVDAVVTEPLRAYYGEAAEAALQPGAAPGKAMLNLWEANRIDLTRAGVTTVGVAGECTACGAGRLFSHRAERGTAGRGAAVIALV